VVVVVVIVVVVEGVDRGVAVAFRSSQVQTFGGRATSYVLRPREEG
jgi:hypothetical protein